MVRVKICGITSSEDALAAVRLGADALGFVFAQSPRQISPDRAQEIIRQIPALIQTVGVFVNATPDWMQEVRTFCGLDLLQLHGEEPPEVVARVGGRVIKGIRVGADHAPSWDAYPETTLLLDTYVPHARGGTGASFDWNLAREAARRRPIILAGGLTAENVQDAIGIVRPYAVDVSSGVEQEPGRKDHERLARFIQRAKSLDVRAR
jgi:phosphoribosylanthranilate isomerase